MDAAAFAIGWMLAIHSGRINLMALRGGVDLRNQSWPRMLIGTASFVAQIAIAIWGFFGLAWWLAILILLVGMFVGGMTVTNRNFAAAYSFQPLTEVVVIGCCLWLWIWQFPY